MTLFCCLPKSSKSLLWDSRNLHPVRPCSSRPSFCPDCRVSFSSIIRAIRRRVKPLLPPPLLGQNRQNIAACISGGHSGGHKQQTNKQTNKQKFELNKVKFTTPPAPTHLQYNSHSWQILQYFSLQNGFYYTACIQLSTARYFSIPRCFNVVHPKSK